jgi:spore germination cell wall hydrolase CwlJ-like protein
MITALACLATAIYFEARGEPTAGQIAVGQVIMSRVNDYRYPDNVCDVVKEGYYYSWNPSIPIPDKCQFSFFCDGKPEEIKDAEAYEWAEEIAWGLLEGPLDLIDLTNGATHYHAHYVLPSWSKRFTQTVRINDHIFYRWEMDK